MFKIKGQVLQDILNFIYFEGCSSKETFLEIIVQNEDLIIAVNYNCNYYIRYTLNNYEDILEHENLFCVLDLQSLVKIHKMVLLWPMYEFTFKRDDDIVTVESDNKLPNSIKIRENPVHVSAKFKKSKNDFYLEPPPDSFNCKVNTRSLLKMIDLFDTKGDIFIKLDTVLNIYSDTTFSVSSGTVNDEIFTHTDIEVLKETDSLIKLNCETNKLLINYLRALTKMGNITVYLMTIEKTQALSIMAKFSDIESVQFYSVHD